MARKPAPSLQQEPASQAPPQPQRAFPVSWDQFHRDARALARRLAEAGRSEIIVAITRGGLWPAATSAPSRHPHHRYGLRCGLRSHQPGRGAAPQEHRARRGGGERRAAAGRADRRRPGGNATRQARARSVARRALRRGLCQAHGPPASVCFITEVSQDTWIYFPWDTGLPAADPRARALISRL